MRLSNRVSAIQPSATLAITALAKRLAAEGQDIIAFTAGEPDFTPPPPVRAAALKAVEENRSKYAPAAGLPALRSLVAEKLKKENGLTYEAGQIVITVGAKQAIFNALSALLNPGDEALILSPYWVSYPEQVKAAEGVPVIVETDGEFIVDPQALEQAMTDRTRVLIVNSPNNPTGAVYPKESLTALADVLRRHPEVTVISDEIYEMLLFDGNRHTGLLQVAEDLTDRTVLVNGFSKSLAIPGWRVGYAAGPPELIGAMIRLQGHATSNAPTIAQYGALASTDVETAWFDEILADLDNRRRIIVAGLNEIEGITCAMPPGTFYAFADLSGLLPGTLEGRPVEDSTEFARLLLEREGVAVIPGTPFGAPNHLRFTFTTALPDIQRGLERVARFADGLRS